MMQTFSWAKMARVIGYALFITVPAMAIAAFGVQALRNWLATSFGLEVPGLVYALALIAAVWGAIWLSSGRLLAEFRQSGRPGKGGDKT